ncbi:hypothetical protein [Stigmatella aurantiaca]|uniref:Uncharacterized protein n=1 Tax=Stigmatella aurantiaca (strain DW4/3-1) TaxID=378806 RepID=Q09CA5_STIAD|nr:hypothetical protein [Stigmatella aurantiaca]ADO69555.1 uncharacterized protein STAUR_1751 [Stigmatella aurantiaca DW4/3-1]EAU69392.1 hypothetical protein STIAU_3733 [Stigmatella aurantiaca DW4/3-1]
MAWSCDCNHGTQHLDSVDTCPQCKKKKPSGTASVKAQGNGSLPGEAQKAVLPKPSVNKPVLKKAIGTQPASSKPPSDLLGWKSQLDSKKEAKVESNAWATGHGIWTTLSQLLNGRAYVIHPDLCSISSPLSATAANAEEGQVNYAKTLRGYIIQATGQAILNGILNTDATKPVVMILNTGEANAQSSSDAKATGGMHWVACVALPAQYQPPQGAALHNANPRIFFIDSLNENRQLPQAFKNVLSNGINTNTPNGVHQVPAAYPNAQFIDIQNIPQQSEGYDCGWWATYNALMLVLTSSEAYTAAFVERTRAFAFQLRALMPNLEADVPAGPKGVSKPSSSAKKAEPVLSLYSALALQPRIDSASWGKALASATESHQRLTETILHGHSVQGRFKKLLFTHATGKDGLLGVITTNVLTANVERNVNFRYDLDTRYCEGVYFIMKPDFQYSFTSMYQDLYKKWDHLRGSEEPATLEKPLVTSAKAPSDTNPWPGLDEGWKKLLNRCALDSDFRIHQLKRLKFSKPIQRSQAGWQDNFVLTLVNPQIRIPADPGIEFEKHVYKILVAQPIHEELVALSGDSLKKFTQTWGKGFNTWRTKHAKFVKGNLVSMAGAKVAEHALARYKALFSKGRIIVYPVKSAEFVHQFGRSTSGNQLVRARKMEAAAALGCEYASTYFPEEMNNSQAALTLEAFTQAQKEYYRVCMEAGCARVS